MPELPAHHHGIQARLWFARGHVMAPDAMGAFWICVIACPEPSAQSTWQKLRELHRSEALLAA